MTLFLFVGDMLVMFFMAVLVIWVTTRDGKEAAEHHARIPLEDE
tara:strand:+ start:1406 stop:1537 length:132 start_codon:yes stop_codon:yes gene_type:complete